VNVDQDRQRLRLRALVGASVSLGDGFDMCVRVATGDSKHSGFRQPEPWPCQPRQGGNFSKYQMWLDRAFLSYRFGDQPIRTLLFC